MSREPIAYCEACLAPFYEGDDFICDDGGSLLCLPAIDREGPCYANRVEKNDGATTERVARAIERIEETIHQINNHWWNRRKRPEAEDLRILIDQARSLSSVSGEEN